MVRIHHSKIFTSEYTVVLEGQSDYLFLFKPFLVNRYKVTTDCQHFTQLSHSIKNRYSKREDHG